MAELLRARIISNPSPKRCKLYGLGFRAGFRARPPVTGPAIRPAPDAAALLASAEGTAAFRAAGSEGIEAAREWWLFGYEAGLTELTRVDSEGADATTAAVTHQGLDAETIPDEGVRN